MHWVRVTENTPPTGADRLVYDHTPEDRWKAARPFGINHQEDSETEHPGEMTLHLDGGTGDMATHEGDWDDTCIGRVEGGCVVLLYSGDLWRRRKPSARGRGTSKADPEVLPQGVSGVTIPPQWVG